MANEIEIGVTKIENIIEISSQPTDQIIDIVVTDNRDDVVLNITPSVIEININRGTTTAGLVTSVNGKIGDVIIDANDVGLGNVDNTGDFQKPISNDVQVALNEKADLIDGLVPTYQLPSFVDDVLEYADFASFPTNGEIGKIYIAISPDSLQYRWTSSAYLQITNGLIASTNDVPEGNLNLYFLASRVLSTILTGLSTASNAVITATDTVLSALGKLQGQVSLKANDNSVVHLSGTETITGNKIFTGALTRFDNPILIKQLNSTDYNQIGAYSGRMEFQQNSGSQLSFNMATNYFDFGLINKIAKVSNTLLTANRNFEFPNASGTIALTSDLPTSADYIQNGTTQQTANLNISGSGTFGSVISNLIDSSSTVVTARFSQFLPNPLGLTFISEGSTGRQIIQSGYENGSSYFTLALNPNGGPLTVGGAATFSSSVTTASLNSTGASNFATTSGNVGIGTTNPTKKLHINGTGNFTGDLTIGVDNVAGEYYLDIKRSSTVPVNIQATLAGVGPSSLSMQTGGGNLGIGTTSPTEKLEVNGNIKAGAAIFSSSVTATSFNGGAALTGIPTAPTATEGTNTTQIATTAFVQSVVTTGATSVIKSLNPISHTGTTVNTVLVNILIPANTISTSSVYELNICSSRGAGDGSGASLTANIGAATNFVRGVPIGTGANSIIHLIRHLQFNSGNLIVFSNSGSFYTDLQSIQSKSITIFDTTVSQNLTVSIQLANAADTYSLDYVILKRID